MQDCVCERILKCSEMNENLTRVIVKYGENHNYRNYRKLVFLIKVNFKTYFEFYI